MGWMGWEVLVTGLLELLVEGGECFFDRGNHSFRRVACCLRSLRFWSRGVALFDRCSWRIRVCALRLSGCNSVVSRYLIVVRGEDDLVHCDYPAGDV